MSTNPPQIAINPLLFLPLTKPFLPLFRCGNTANTPVKQQIFEAQEPQQKIQLVLFLVILVNVSTPYPPPPFPFSRLPPTDFRFFFPLLRMCS